MMTESVHGDKPGQCVNANNWGQRLIYHLISIAEMGGVDINIISTDIRKQSRYI